MWMKWHHIVVAATILVSISFDSGKRPARVYPQGYFRSPVGNALQLTGTFGELRSNHFHSGIDIRAKDGRSGEPIFAAADGFVSRIKIQSGGYGNALYIEHPNGFTTVYAHLKDYAPAIRSLIKQQQYAKESFEIDLSLQPTDLPVTKGQEIGKLGNTGSSAGPHLHFEIRDAKTEKPLNPLLFGFSVRDNIPPAMSVLRVYSLNDRRETVQAKTIYLQKYAQGYGVKGDTLVIEGWRCGFGLKTFDTGNGLDNLNGIYSLKLYADDSLLYAFRTESFAFGETRYINAHTDYAEHMTKKVMFHKTFLLPGNFLSMYDQVNHAGMVSLYRDKPVRIRMVASDYYGNSSQMQCWVRRSDSVASPPPKLYNYVLPYGEENVVRTDHCYLYFPKGALYENLYLNLQKVQERSSGVFSNAYHVHDRTFPVHRYFDIAIFPQNLPPSLQSKAFIAYCDADHRIYSFGGTWSSDGFLRAKADRLGDFCIMTDTIAPSIKPLSFEEDMTKATAMKFSIRDNIYIAGRASDLKYRATVDGRWVLLEYDAKNDLLIHTFDGTIAPGNHQLTLTVVDDRGNETVFEGSFKR